MKISYNKQQIEVSAKVKHFLDADNARLKRENNRYNEYTTSFDAFTFKKHNLINEKTAYEDYLTYEQEVAELNSQPTQDYLKLLRKVLRENKSSFTLQQQEIIVLRFNKHKSIAEIAKIMSVSKGTMQSYLSRICGKIEKLIQKNL